MNVCRGGRKNQLNASMLATETGKREAQAPDDRDRQDGEDVEHAEAEHRDPLLEERDHSGDRGDQRRADR